MNRSIKLTIVLLLLSTMTVTAVLAARDPYIGTWESTDWDGSYQTLTIGAGPDNTYHVRYYDFGASVCGTDPQTNEFYAASARGFLSPLDGNIEGTIAVTCLTRPPEFYNDADVTYGYDSSNDTLIGADGNTWDRR